MVIQRYGNYFTKLSVGDQVIGLNAPGKESSLGQSRFGATVALQSLNHPDFNGIEALEGNKNNTCYAITGPGEYEIADIFVQGFATQTKYADGIEQINTVYSLLFDGIRIVYLGPLSSTALPESAEEDLYQADIIFVPIGGDNVLGSEEAFKFIKKFSPKIIIPIAYDEQSNKADLEAFTSHFGDHAKAEDKLTIKKKDIEGEGMEVVVLKEVK